MTKISQQLFKLSTQDGEQIALWKVYAPEQPSKRSILLTHGTFSNKKVCLGIASYFVEKGYTCWIMEWRNHGDSPSTEKQFNFESIAFYDLPAALSFLLDKQGVEHLDCITHSGGGVCLTQCLIHYPHYQSKISRMAFFGCQAFGAASNRSNRIKIMIGKYISSLIGRVPASATGLGEHDESYYLMQQWYEWNLSGQFVGLEDFDYRKQMPSVRIPILSVSGVGDTFIAPPEGCRLFLEAFKNPENRFLLCGKKSGFSEDYNHSRVLHSSKAKEEIWPLVSKWFQFDHYEIS